MEQININNKSSQRIGAFALTMIAIGAIVTVRAIPEIAVYGEACILTIIMASLIFMIPLTISCLELSIAYPKGGGMYTWAKETINVKVGFFEAYLELAANSIVSVIVICFICSNILYLINPSLSTDQNIVFVFGSILFIIVTYINCKGLKISALMSSICAVLGVLIPMTAIIIAGLYTFIMDSSVLNFSMSNLVPALRTFDYWTSLTSVVLGLSGVEVIVVHVRNVINVKRDYTIALITLAIMAGVCYIMASLSVAAIVPKEKILFAAGVSQVINIFFNNIGMGYMAPIVVILTCIGALGALNSWTISTIKSLWIAAEDGSCHKIFAKTNENGAPITLLISQLALVIIILGLITFSPTFNDSFWILTVLCSQNSILVYLIVFYAHSKHITSNEKTNIIYKTIKFVSIILGISICLFTFFIGFLPNPIISLAQNKPLYFMIVLIGLILSWLPVIPLYLSGKNNNK